MTDHEDSSDAGVPEQNFDYQINLLEQELQRGSPEARLRGGMSSSEMTESLRTSAERLVEEMRIRPGPLREDPFATSDRWLKIIVHLALDRMLSHPLGIDLEPVGSTDSHHLRIHVPANRHPPEQFELRILGASRQNE